MDKEILSGLLKRAKGYSYKEVTEEYSVKEDGKPELIKRKVTKKYCPPDSSALKAYMELNGEKRDVSELSDDELIAEREKLLALLKDQNEDNDTDDTSE